MLKPKVIGPGVGEEGSPQVMIISIRPHLMLHERDGTSCNAHEPVACILVRILTLLFLPDDAPLWR